MLNFLTKIWAAFYRVEFLSIPEHLSICAFRCSLLYAQHGFVFATTSFEKWKDDIHPHVLENAIFWVDSDFQQQKSLPKPIKISPISITPVWLGVVQAVNNSRHVRNHKTSILAKKFDASFAEKNFKTTY